jgi:hypothetical protein
VDVPASEPLVIGASLSVSGSPLSVAPMPSDGHPASNNEEQTTSASRGGRETITA